jgi:VWFA-related protein
MRFISTGLILTLLLTGVIAQTQEKKLPLKQDVSQDDIIRISTSLVQTDVVVTDKNDQIISDLTLQDFEIYDNGKKQEIKFMEFVGVDMGRRSEGSRSGVAAEAERATSVGPSAKDVKRVVAFVIDDLTIPIQDLYAVRQMLTDFVDKKM